MDNKQVTLNLTDQSMQTYADYGTSARPHIVTRAGMITPEGTHVHYMNKK